jgi:hypothetical protein
MYLIAYEFVSGDTVSIHTFNLSIGVDDPELVSQVLVIVAPLNCLFPLGELSAFERIPNKLPLPVCIAVLN